MLIFETYLSFELKKTRGGGIHADPARSSSSSLLKFLDNGKPSIEIFYSDAYKYESSRSMSDSPSPIKSTKKHEIQPKGKFYNQRTNDFLRWRKLFLLLEHKGRF